ncbi:hypothetical protein M2105_003103 [Paenibacillus sp. PastF-1]|nr:hypothetical protein [Paenibacillus sp. PastF-2]MDF9848677.1 hypothetical protein [Paenibacillus sp. PastM-2]MDF9855246.1 hypothetical protein [Paenibacillus sp. PastF-1]MDH6480517.1 hypothetical protein [Paenibacillus sp. PastH-2]MDH6507944.1 hypothetical protein [Paenibacillus sp. PastM-3]
MVHKKKYFTLLPPFLILGIILAYNLPYNKRSYALLLTTLAFWITYYTWIYIEKMKLKKKE